MSLDTSDCIVVVPCYNEAHRLCGDPFLDFVARRPRSGLIFVDDGSSDGTPRAIEAIVKRAPGRIGLLSLEQNQGKGEAVRRGLLRALEMRPRYAGFWDADLATPLDEVDRFERHLDAHPAVQMAIGSRVRMLGHAIHRTRARRQLSRVASAAISRVLRAPVHDSQCGAKLCRTTLETRAVLERPFATRWLFDVELLARYGSQGSLHDLVHELPLRRWESVAGSRLGTRELVRIPLELLRIARLHGGQRGDPPASYDGRCP